MRINDQNLQGLGNTGASGLGSTNRTGGAEELTGSRSPNRTETTSGDGDRVQLSGLSQALRRVGDAVLVALKVNAVFREKRIESHGRCSFRM